MIGLGDLPGGEVRSSAFGISADGSTIVGFSSNRFSSIGRGFQAFRWTLSEGMIDLGSLPGAIEIIAFDVSGDGSTIVGRAFSETGEEAFVWDQQAGMQNLQQVLTDDLGLDLDGWTLGRADGISDDGLTIVGVGTNPSGFTEAWIAIIPEPSTALLFASGLVAMAAARRSTRRCH